MLVQTARPYGNIGCLTEHACHDQRAVLEPAGPGAHARMDSPHTFVTLVASTCSCTAADALHCLQRRTDHRLSSNGAILYSIHAVLVIYNAMMLPKTSIWWCSILPCINTSGQRRQALPLQHNTARHARCRLDAALHQLAMSTLCNSNLPMRCRYAWEQPVTFLQTCAQLGKGTTRQGSCICGYPHGAMSISKPLRTGVCRHDDSSRPGGPCEVAYMVQEAQRASRPGGQPCAQGHACAWPAELVRGTQTVPSCALPGASYTASHR